MKKVIVLGSNGQLGMTIKDLTPRETLELSFFSRKDLDITDRNKLTKAFKHADFDYCINCAAYTNVEGAETNIEDAFLINAEGAKNIAKVCKAYQVKLIHISTDYVFDGKKLKPYTTIDTPNPINEYGKSKLQGELYVQEKLKEYYIIRTSWLYSLHGKNFLKTIISKIKNDETLSITTGEEGTPTSCLDLSAFIFHIIETDKLPYGIYNFSAKGSTTWFRFAKEIVRNLDAEKLDKISPVESFKTLAKRPKYSVLSLNKTKRYFEELSTWQKSVRIMVKKI
ncbi:dTDP-4-dehydrorhamnose reductase [uncultured Winogradskyella sp.]|uniref:dTDP-4-dehydrorhamnose reductase n=1 Tax=uncultured Winogradskyella sp. TaxID=395353 RepID=UPI0026269A00|nr:dTDP-4-dehydrorhamnose reductase [uncultured Winogradskyella sp.]